VQPPSTPHASHPFLAAVRTHKHRGCHDQVATGNPRHEQASCRCAADVQKWPTARHF
jgi:hypothetical protein